MISESSADGGIIIRF